MAVRRVLGVIPARLGSERLPRKPLHRLAGRPLIEWVWRRVANFGVLDNVVIATDAQEVADVCAAIGANVVLTSELHRSGTDRVAEVASREEYAGYEVIVNVQGDEPFLEESHVSAAARLVLDGWEVGTIAAPVADAEAWRNPGVVKVVRREDGTALYFSRAPIPFKREGEPRESELSRAPYLRHMGVYAYSPAALRRWVSLPESELERIEKLEQLRALEAGIRIGVALVTPAAGGVDTAEDAARAESILKSHVSKHSPRW